MLPSRGRNWNGAIFAQIKKSLRCENILYRVLPLTWLKEKKRTSFEKGLQIPKFCCPHEDLTMIVALLNKTNFNTLITYIRGLSPVAKCLVRSHSSDRPYTWQVTLLISGSALSAQEAWFVLLSPNCTTNQILSWEATRAIIKLNQKVIKWLPDLECVTEKQ